MTWLIWSTFGAGFVAGAVVGALALFGLLTFMGLLRKEG